MSRRTWCFPHVIDKTPPACRTTPPAVKKTSATWACTDDGHHQKRRRSKFTRSHLLAGTPTEATRTTPEVLWRAVGTRLLVDPWEGLKLRDSVVTTRRGRVIV